MTLESESDRKEPQDIVWDRITDSAKTRFDYDALVSAFDEVGNAAMAENLLFQILVGLATEKDEEILAAELTSQLMILGIEVGDDSILELIREIRPSAVKEVLATEMALALFHEGNDPIDVLAAISSVL